MPNERISMPKLKQLIGLQASNLSVRALARTLGLSVGGREPPQFPLRTRTRRTAAARARRTRLLRRDRAVGGCYEPAYTPHMPAAIRTRERGGTPTSSEPIHVMLHKLTCAPQRRPPAFHY